MAPSNLSGIAGAHVEQDGPNRVPILTKGNPSPEAIQEFENGCLDYFGEKDIAEEKQTAKILLGFNDPRIQAHINANHARLAALPFADFMKEFRGLFLTLDWEGSIRRKLMSASMGSKTFWDYAAAAQNLNILLIGTHSHLTDNKLRHQLEVGMTEKLARKCQAEKANDIEDLRKWMLEVKRIDDGHCAERLEFEEIARTTHNEACKSNALSEPSRHANASYTTNNGGSGGYHKKENQSASGSNRPCLPKLTESERTLIYDNQGCLKCRKLLVDHRMANCLNGFPNPTTYHTLTQRDIEAVRTRANRTISAITRSSPEPEGDTPHPVALIMAHTHYPAAYLPTNKSCIIGRANPQMKIVP
jgi:hypothetical protein